MININNRGIAIKMSWVEKWEFFLILKIVRKEDWKLKIKGIWIKMSWVEENRQINNWGRRLYYTSIWIFCQILPRELSWRLSTANFFSRNIRTSHGLPDESQKFCRKGYIERKFFLEINASINIFCTFRAIIFSHFAQMKPACRKFW